MFAADMHCDTISKLYEEQKKGNPVNLCENNFQVDLNKLKRGQYLLQNFAVFTAVSGKSHLRQVTPIQGRYAGISGI